MAFQSPITLGFSNREKGQGIKTIPLFWQLWGVKDMCVS